MAHKVIKHMFDDTDGREGAQGHSFALDGVQYEIDLVDDNFKKLHDGLAEFIAGARRTGRATRGTKVATNEETKAIRAWWKNQVDNQTDLSLDLPSYSDRGRVPEVVRAAFRGEPIPTPGTSRSRSKHPGDDEVTKVYDLTGTIRGVADHFNVSYPTAANWVKSIKNDVETEVVNQ